MLESPTPRSFRRRRTRSADFAGRDSRFGRATIGALLALAAALALGGWFRFHGIDFLLPHSPEPDGGKLVFQLDAHEGRVANAEAHPYWGFYPHLLARAAHFAPDAAKSAPPTSSSPLAEHLERASSSYLRMRETVACLSLVGVAATYYLASLFLDVAAAFVASLFMAASFASLWFAQQARPHAAAAAIFLCAVIASIRLRRSGSLVAHLVAALAVGLSIGVLQNGVATVIALVVASRLAPERRGKNLALVASIGVAIAIGLWFYPPSTDVDSANAPLIAFDSKNNVVLLKGHQVMVGLFDGGGFAVIAKALWEYEPLISALALIGLSIAAFERWNHRPAVRPERLGDLKVVIAYVLPYAITIGLYERTYQRFTLPLIPFASVLAASVLARAARRFVSANSLATLAVALPFVGAQFWFAAKLVSIRTAPDTLTEAADWIRANIDPKSKIVVLPGIDLPLVATQAARDRGKQQLAERGYPWTDYQNSRAESDLPAPHFDLAPMPLAPQDFRRVSTDAVQYVKSLDADYAVVAVYRHYWRARVLKTIDDALELGGAPVARFSPDSDADNDYEDLPLTYQDDAIPIDVDWIARTLRAKSTGPVIAIYRLR